MGIIDSGIDITSSDLQSVIYHNDQEISNNQVDDVVNAIKYGYNKGIRLFNCSWDMEVYSEKLYTIMKECSDAIFSPYPENSYILPFIPKPPTHIALGHSKQAGYTCCTSTLELFFPPEQTKIAS